MGSNGTVVSTPQLLQMAGYIVRGAIEPAMPVEAVLVPPAGAGLGAGRAKRRADEDFFL
jgi:hypothetical protein